MKRLSILLIFALVMAVVPMAPAAATGKTPSRGLKPGEFVTFEQKVPVNLVFVGYEKDQVSTKEVLDQLPEAYDPIVRYPALYGLEGRPMGLHFEFIYKTVFTGRKFEDRFFKYLKTIGEPGEPTSYQASYNDTDSNVLDVTGPVLYIEAPSVEKFLNQNATGLGVNLRMGYTIFFINWYSRPDFQFHVYTKTDVVDPDTGYNFGIERQTRKTIAWGGSHGRSWFYDLSAGPEAWTDNWAVDDKDLDGDGVEDYRMPAIWEYVEGGYRAPQALSGDLGLVARYVGINLLFTSSPLYDPLNTAPEPGGRRVVHVEMFQDDPASSGVDWIDLGFVHNQYEDFQPYYDWHVTLEDNDPIDADAQRALRIWATLLAEDDCWNDYGDPFAELFCFFNANLDTYVPEYNEEDYVAPFFAFNTTAGNLGVNNGLLGFADDNWIDGTQSYVFEFDTAEYRESGYGFSTTTVHEGGHHFGLSHPHDGYDSETGVDYGPENEFYFVWSGDESNTIMHYMDLSDEFGQFDRDNMYRFEFAGYMNWANDLVDDVVAHPEFNRVKALVLKANSRARLAIRSFERWEYLRAVVHARAVYELVGQAADILGIEPAPEPAMLRMIPGSPIEHMVDPIRFPDD